MPASTRRRSRQDADTNTDAPSTTKSNKQSRTTTTSTTTTTRKRKSSAIQYEQHQQATASPIVPIRSTASSTKHQNKTSSSAAKRLRFDDGGSLSIPQRTSPRSSTRTNITSVSDVAMGSSITNPRTNPRRADVASQPIVSVQRSQRQTNQAILPSKLARHRDRADVAPQPIVSVQRTQRQPQPIAPVLRIQRQPNQAILPLQPPDTPGAPSGDVQRRRSMTPAAGAQQRQPNLARPAAVMHASTTHQQQQQQQQPSLARQAVANQSSLTPQRKPRQSTSANNSPQVRLVGSVSRVSIARSRVLREGATSLQRLWRGHSARTQIGAEQQLEEGNTGIQPLRVILRLFLLFTLCFCGFSRISSSENNLMGATSILEDINHMGRTSNTLDQTTAENIPCVPAYGLEFCSSDSQQLLDDTKQLVRSVVNEYKVPLGLGQQVDDFLETYDIAIAAAEMGMSRAKQPFDLSGVVVACTLAFRGYSENEEYSVDGEFSIVEDNSKDKQYSKDEEYSKGKDYSSDEKCVRALSELVIISGEDPWAQQFKTVVLSALGLLHRETIAREHEKAMVTRIQNHKVHETTTVLNELLDRLEQDQEALAALLVEHTYDSVNFQEVAEMRVNEIELSTLAITYEAKETIQISQNAVAELPALLIEIKDSDVISSTVLAEMAAAVLNLETDAHMTQQELKTKHSEFEQRKLKIKQHEHEAERQAASGIKDRVESMVWLALAADGGKRDVSMVSAGAHIRADSIFEGNEQYQSPALTPWQWLETNVLDPISSHVPLTTSENEHQLNAVFSRTRPTRDCWRTSQERKGRGRFVNLTVELPYATKILGLAVEHGLVELDARHDQSVAPQHIQLWGVRLGSGGIFCRNTDTSSNNEVMWEQGREDFNFASSFSNLGSWWHVAVDKALEVAGWIPPSGNTRSQQNTERFGRLNSQNCTNFGGGGSGVLLAEMWYDVNGKRTQVVDVTGGNGSITGQTEGSEGRNDEESTEGDDLLWKTVKVAVRSNHGHPDYTCLHRISVLGESVTGLLRGGDI